MQWYAFGCVGAALLVWIWFDVKGLRNNSMTLRAIADIIAAIFLAAAVGLLALSMMP